MAYTYYNQTVLGGTSYPRYPDPLVTGKPSADNLYPWSTFRARFATYTASTGVVDASVTFAEAAGPINLLLYTSDIPACGYVSGLSTGAPLAPVAPSAQVGTTGVTAFFKATPSGADVTVSAGQVGVGYSYNAGASDPNKNIYVAGFPAGAAGVDSTGLDLWLWANSANIASPVSFQNWATVGQPTAATSGALPIVLAYGDYSQAIRDAGNVVVSGAGVTYQVVGLWSQGPAPAPPIVIG